MSVGSALSTLFGMSTLHYLVSTIFGVFGIALQNIFTCAARTFPSNIYSLLLFSAIPRLQSFLFSMGCWYDAVDRLSRCHKKKNEGSRKNKKKKWDICYRLIFLSIHPVAEFRYSLYMFSRITNNCIKYDFLLFCRRLRSMNAMAVSVE